MEKSREIFGLAESSILTLQGAVIESEIFCRGCNDPIESLTEMTPLDSRLLLRLFDHIRDEHNVKMDSILTAFETNYFVIKPKLTGLMPL